VDALQSGERFVLDPVDLRVEDVVNLVFHRLVFGLAFSLDFFDGLLDILETSDYVTDFAVDTILFLDAPLLERLDFLDAVVDVFEHLAAVRPERWMQLSGRKLAELTLPDAALC
jgi:hypothetical protein